MRSIELPLLILSSPFSLQIDFSGPKSWLSIYWSLVYLQTSKTWTWQHPWRLTATIRGYTVQRKSEVAEGLYNLFELCPYWFRLDDIGNIIDGWIDLNIGDTLVYVPHKDAMQAPPSSLFNKNLGFKPSFNSVTLENGEMRGAYCIQSHMSFDSFRKIDLRAEKLNVQYKFANWSRRRPQGLCLSLF